MNTKMQIVERYLQLVSEFNHDPAAYEPLLHLRMIETEYPNRLSPRIRERGFEEGMQGIALGRKLLRFQQYDIQQHFEGEDSLTVEVIWRGEMAMDAGPLKQHQALRAYVCFVFQFREGRIYRLRHYDCYEPF